MQCDTKYHLLTITTFKDSQTTCELNIVRGNFRGPKIVNKGFFFSKAAVIYYNNNTLIC